MVADLWRQTSGRPIQYRMLQTPAAGVKLGAADTFAAGAERQGWLYIEGGHDAHRQRS